jgi:hypothetical protein
MDSIRKVEMRSFHFPVFLSSTFVSSAVGVV